MDSLILWTAWLVYFGHLLLPVCGTAGNLKGKERKLGAGCFFAATSLQLLSSVPVAFVGNPLLAASALTVVVLYPPPASSGMGMLMLSTASRTPGSPQPQTQLCQRSWTASLHAVL